MEKPFEERPDKKKKKEMIDKNVREALLSDRPSSMGNREVPM